MEIEVKRLHEFENGSLKTDRVMIGTNICNSLIIDTKQVPELIEKLSEVLIKEMPCTSTK